MPRDDDPQAGFTLIELLVALALLAVTASLLATAIGSARRAIEVVDRRAAHASVPAVQSVLRHLLTEARTIPDGPAAHDDPARAFVGESDRMRFISSFVPQGQYGGLWRYEISLDAGALVLTEQLVRPDFATTADAQLRIAVISGVETLRLRYFGAEDREGVPGWQDGWHAPQRAPRLVTVEMTFAPGDDRQWTPLVVSLPMAD